MTTDREYINEYFATLRALQNGSLFVVPLEKIDKDDYYEWIINEFARDWVEFCKGRGYFNILGETLTIEEMTKDTTWDEWVTVFTELFRVQFTVNRLFGENDKWGYYSNKIQQFLLELESEKLRIQFWEMFVTIHTRYIYFDEYLRIGIQNEEKFELFVQCCNAFEGYTLNKLGRSQAKNFDSVFKKLLNEGHISQNEAFWTISELMSNVKFEIFELLSIGGKKPIDKMIFVEGLRPLFEHIQNIKDVPLPAKKLPKPKGKKTSNPLYHSLKPAQIEALYEDLKGKYIAPDTTLEQFQALFDGEVTEMLTPIQWAESNRLLVYLLEKIFKRWQSYFERKKAFVNQNGKPLTASDFSTALHDSNFMGFPIGSDRIDKIFDTIRKLNI